MNDKNKKYYFTDEELRKMMEGVVEKYHKLNADPLEIINYKLDAIELQTTKTNSRLTKVEDQVKDLEFSDATRIVSCPQASKIDQLIESSISTKTIKNIVIRGIVIAGIFFTILFGILRVFFDGGVS